MNDRMGLDLIAEIMGWDDEDGTATRKYRVAAAYGARQI